MNDDISEIIKAVAEGLGWGILPHPHCWGPAVDVWSPSGDMGGQLLPSDNSIMVSAYAKAEMAHRGYACEADCRDVWVWWSRWDVITGRRRPQHETTPHGYDPTDPISEAHAVLRAIAEALKGGA